MAVPVAAVAAAATACGTSGDATKSDGAAAANRPAAPGAVTSSPSMSSPGTSSPTTSAAQATIATATVGNLGQVLVDGQGRTVYLFEKDQGGTSSCTGSCAAVWPPVTSMGKPHAGSGAQASMLGTTSRSDGSTQVTYGGHPLYYFVPDNGVKGSAKGQGLNQFGGGWYVVSPDGKKVEKSGS
ncbi:hypothetical protein [Actinomadura rugatobispora]|uniref:Lipoprotein n=1 Tax=Actinomadura rugatobispora TaxID=1994 RepID=A0ABW0ZRK8_9ACTN|nr:lipoprotein [Actinomadura rugatobispora]